MEKLTLEQYYKKYDPPEEENHCGNCEKLEGCLNFFAQPTYNPKNASKSCSAFIYVWRCAKCGSRLEDRSRDGDSGAVYTFYYCPTCKKYISGDRSRYYYSFRDKGRHYLGDTSWLQRKRAKS